MILPLPRRFSERGPDRPLFGEGEAPVKKRGSFAKKKRPCEEGSSAKKEGKALQRRGELYEDERSFLKKERLC